MTQDLNGLTSLSCREWGQLKRERNWKEHIERIFDKEREKREEGFPGYPSTLGGFKRLKKSEGPFCTILRSHYYIPSHLVGRFSF